jgi:hypothetical protein
VIAAYNGQERAVVKPSSTLSCPVARDYKCTSDGSLSSQFTIISRCNAMDSAFASSTSVKIRSIDQNAPYSLSDGVQFLDNGCHVPESSLLCSVLDIPSRNQLLSSTAWSCTRPSWISRYSWRILRCSSSPVSCCCNLKKSERLSNSHVHPATPLAPNITSTRRP